MKITNTYKGYTGAELLAMTHDDNPMVDVDGTILQVLPGTLPFVNRWEISSVDDATHVSVKSRFDTVIVRI